VSSLRNDTEGARAAQPLWLTIVQSVAIITVPPATFYALGVVALWLPIAMDYTHDFSTAWYATSLVPRTVVIGQGIKTFGPPLLITLGSALWVWSLGRGSGRQSISLLSWLAIPVGLAATYFGFLWLQNPEHFMWVPSWGQSFSGLGAAEQWIIRLAAVLLLLGGGAGGYFMASSTERSNFIPVRFRVVSWKRFLGGVTILYGAALLIALVSAALRVLPMPYMEIQRQQENSTLSGALLANSEGSWYIFEPEGNLTVLPNDQVKSAQVLSFAQLIKNFDKVWGNGDESDIEGSFTSDAIVEINPPLVAGRDTYTAAEFDNVIKCLRQ
jgi:hypothetical protein